LLIIGRGKNCVKKFFKPTTGGIGRPVDTAELARNFKEPEIDSKFEW
jgi:hypothetical protein